MLAIGGPDIGGLWLTARAGGIRDRFLEHLRAIMAVPFLRLAPGASAASLCGRLDIARTTSSGRIVWEPGILAAVDGGSLVIPMAERLEPGAAAIIAEAMDTRACRGGLRVGLNGTVPAAFSVIALDEAAEPEETLPTALSDRLGLHVNLDGIAWQTVCEAPPALLLPVNAWRTVSIDDRLMEQLFAIATSGGHASLRAFLHLVTVSRILAAMEGRAMVLPEDGLAALRLCSAFAWSAANRKTSHNRPHRRLKPTARRQAGPIRATRRRIRRQTAKQAAHCRTVSANCWPPSNADRSTGCRWRSASEPPGRAPGQAKPVRWPRMHGAAEPMRQAPAPPFRMHGPTLSPPCAPQHHGK